MGYRNILDRKGIDKTGKISLLYEKDRDATQLSE